MSGGAFRAGKRMLCVGRGERCFACGGRGGAKSVPRTTAWNLDVDRCPVCRGRGRVRVVRKADGR